VGVVPVGFPVRCFTVEQVIGAVLLLVLTVRYAAIPVSGFLRVEWAAVRHGPSSVCVCRV
jgi:hypothetical protein